MQENFNRGAQIMIPGGSLKKVDLMILMHLLLLVPINLEVKGGRNGRFLGEYAFLITSSSPVNVVCFFQ
jgi:hypothetical protein